MSFAQVEYFVAVAKAGNVGRASRALRIAQPAVSRQIRNLESELGTELFVRTRQGMQLSTSGATFLQHAKAILAAVEEARLAIRGSAPRS